MKNKYGIEEWNTIPTVLAGQKEKYYIFCTDETREGWYEEFNDIEKAKEYIEENYGNCEILIKGTEIEYYFNSNTKIEVEQK